MSNETMFRRRCFLRSTSNIIKLSGTIRHQIDLPSVLIEKMDWKINDKLKVDIIKSGIDNIIQIVKEGEV